MSDVPDALSAPEPPGEKPPAASLRPDGLHHPATHIKTIMRKLFLSLTLLLTAAWAAAAGKDSYTVIISLDGFRWDYTEAYDTPFFDRLALTGVKAIMQPSFPSKTFPNHYTLATGLVPDHHGIIANKFKVLATGEKFSLSDKDISGNPKFYGGDPIWLTAKHQGVRAGVIFWVGSDVPIKGEHPDYWHPYSQSAEITFPDRADEIVKLLSLPKKDRPHLVMAYFEQPDAHGHTYGPVTMPTRRALESLDSLLDNLWTRIQALPVGDNVNLIITGDHGMTMVPANHQLYPKDFLKDEWVDCIRNDLPALVYASKPEYVDSIYNALNGVDHLRVWRKGQVPAYLNYGTNPNMGDLIVLPDLGWVFDKTEWPVCGTHGYDPTYSDMLVAFRAIGPDFKQGYTRPGAFRNVCIYPLLCHLLGLTPSPNDGSLEEVSDMLR